MHAHFLRLFIKWIPVALLILLIFIAYSPGLDSQFQFDDYPNIVQNDRLHIDSLSTEQLKRVTYSGHSGVLKRPISMLSFGINHYFSELNPLPYKITNLFIHIANSIIIFSLSLLLMRKLYLNNPCSNTRLIGTSLFIALTWGVSPINLTSVLYVVQRMTSLSASFVLIGMVMYFFAREAAETHRTKASWTYLTLLIIAGGSAILSKENGALIFVFLLLIELIIYRGNIFYPQRNWVFIAFFAGVLLVPAIAIAIYTLLDPTWLTHSYSSTAFTLPERLFTQFRVLWSYVTWIFFPSNQALGLFHDDITISTDLINPLSTLSALLGHIGVLTVVLLLWLSNKLPAVVFGICLFYSSHLIESTIIALELVHEHRNYIGSFGLIFALAGATTLLDGKLVKAMTLSGFAYALLLLVITSQRSVDWGNGLESALIEVSHHPLSSATHYEVGRQYTSLFGYTDEAYVAAAENAFRQAADLDKTRADALFALVMMAIRRQTPIDSALIDELHLKLRTGPLYAGHATWLKTLVTCYKDQECLVSQDLVTAVLQSALNNPNILNASLASAVTYAVAAEFLGHIGAYANALEMSVLAIERAENNLNLVVSLINLALYYSDKDTASMWIQQLKDRDYTGAYATDIDIMRKQLLALPNKTE